MGDSPLFELNCHLVYFLKDPEGTRIINIKLNDGGYDKGANQGPKSPLIYEVWDVQLEGPVNLPRSLFQLTTIGKGLLDVYESLASPETAIWIMGPECQLQDSTPDHQLSMVVQGSCSTSRSGYWEPNLWDSESQNDNLSSKTEHQICDLNAVDSKESHITWTFRSSISDSSWHGPRHRKWFMTYTLYYTITSPNTKFEWI